MPTYASSVQSSTGNFSHKNYERETEEERRKEGNETKHSNRKEVVKLYLFANGMMVYVENPGEYTQKMLELINEFSKVGGRIEINTQEVAAFLYTNNNLKRKL